MSTLAVGTIKSTSSAAPVIQNTSGTEKGQFAKAWVNFNGTGTVAIRDSFNVSSITDVGTGQYGVNLQNAMANTNYNVCVTDAHDQQVYLLMGVVRVRSDVTITTTFFQVEWLTFNFGNFNDNEECNVAVFGD
tara:strand:- start:504 stop:902 length:399 start_codon:yes stop_codon:yes gene_type:complete